MLSTDERNVFNMFMSPCVHPLTAALCFIVGLTIICFQNPFDTPELVNAPISAALLNDDVRLGAITIIAAATPMLFDLLLDALFGMPSSKARIQWYSRAAIWAICSYSGAELYLFYERQSSLNLSLSMAGEYLVTTWLIRVIWSSAMAFNFHAQPLIFYLRH